MAGHTPIPFVNYLFKDKFNRLLLLIAIAAIVTLLLVFKTLYPFPSFIKNDSYSYIEGASYNLPINIYPIGYSKFLRLFSVFSTSDTALTGFQYLAIQFTGLWLVFTISYIFSTGKVAKSIMVTFVVFNPVSPYISNFISSDALFLSLSVSWFTLLIWYLYRRAFYLIVLQSMILVIAFSVRYNALYYPFLSLVAIFISKENVRNKIVAIALTLIPIAFFISDTSVEYRRLTGINQFNPFEGWQIANNALDAYRYVEPRDRLPCPSKLHSLDSAVRKFFDSLTQLGPQGLNIPLNSTVYMWSPHLPLHDYMFKRFENDTSATYFKQWASMGPLYSEYGKYIISRYPVTYIKFYVWPNIIRFYTPPVWHLEKYNMGCDSVNPIAKNWFRYKNNKVYSAFSDYRVTTLDFYPVMAAIINTLFLLALLNAVIAWPSQGSPIDKKIYLLGALVWFANFAFSVFASPIQLRYQLFSILLSTLLSITLVERLVKTWKSQ